MPISIYPHTQQEEKELLEFLQKNGYDYTISSGRAPIGKTIADEFLEGYDDTDSV